MKQMKTMKQIFAFLLLAIGLSSCASFSEIPRKELLMNVEKGMTRSEVTALLGTPNYRRFDDEVEEWEYLKYISGQTDTIIIICFVNGRVVNLDSFQYHAPVTVAPPVGVSVTPVIASPRPGHFNRRVMNESDFQTFYNKVKNKPFKDDRLQLIEEGVDRQLISCKQCVKLMSIYTFDDDKLSILEIVVPAIADPENNEKIIQSLTYMSSREKARKMLKRYNI